MEEMLACVNAERENKAEGKGEEGGEEMTERVGCWVRCRERSKLSAAGGA